MMMWFLLAANAWAESGAHSAHGDAHHAIPWSSIGIQAFNFGVFFIVLFVLVRKAVKTHFEHRARDYKDMVQRAEAARLEAEQGQREIKQRLAQLEATAAEGLNRAKVESEQLKVRMIQEAQALAQKLEQEAKRSVAVEVEKGKAELAQALLEQALNLSRENLKKSLGTNEQKKLQNEFVEKIQVVGG